MKRFYLLIVLLLITTLTAKDTNSTEHNVSTQEDITQKEVQKQIEREKKYAKEQVFYQGDDYNLSAVEVNEKSLSSIKVIEPDYDFNMDDAYSDEQ
jgi:hypothetical protein